MSRSREDYSLGPGRARAQERARAVVWGRGAGDGGGRLPAGVGEGRPGAAAGAPLRTEVGTRGAESREARPPGSGAGGPGNFPPACARRAKRMTWLHGAPTGPSELSNCSLSPSSGWRPQGLAPPTPPSRPRPRCASASAAAFRASLRPHLVPQALCFLFRASSAERFRASAVPTPPPPDLSTSPPPEGVSAVGERSPSGARWVAADRRDRSSAWVGQTCPPGRTP